MYIEISNVYLYICTCILEKSESKCNFHYVRVWYEYKTIVITRISIPGLKPWRSLKDNRFMYLTFYSARSGKQITSELSHIITSFYMSRESTSYVYTITIQRTGNRGLVGPAPALCWGRATGVMCNIWQLSLGVHTS